MKAVENEKRKKWKDRIQPYALSVLCLTVFTGGWMIEKTYADETLLLSNGTQNESQQDGQSDAANTESQVQLISEESKRTNSAGKEYFHRVRSYPKVSMPNNPQAAEAINTYYQNQVLAQSDQDAEAFIQNSVSEPESYNLDFCYEYLDETTCKRADASAISFSTLTMDYTGGAHGGEYSTSENFDSQTGAHLLLADVLTEDPLSSERLASLIASGLYADQDVYSMLYDTAQIPTNAKKLVTDGKSWYFAQEGMVFYFSTYEIAPYAAGDIEITIPYADLNTIVKEQYLYPGTSFAITTASTDGSSDPYEVVQTQAPSEATADFSYMSQVYNTLLSGDLASMSASAQSDQANQIAKQIAADPSSNGCRVIFLDEQSAKTQTGNGIGLYLFLNEDGSWSSGYGWYYGHYTNGKRDGNGSLFWVREPGSEFYFWLKDGVWQNDTISGAISFSQYTYLNDRYVEAIFSGDYTNGREDGTIHMDCNVDGCVYSFVWNSTDGVRQQITPPDGFTLPDGCYLAALGTSPDTATPRYYYGEPGRPYGIRTELYRKTENMQTWQQETQNNETSEASDLSQQTEIADTSFDQNDTQNPSTEAPALMRCAFEQDYKGVTYTSFKLPFGEDPELYDGKTKLAIAKHSRFVIWNDLVIYGDELIYGMGGSKLYVSNLDGSGEYVIDDSWYDYDNFAVTADGMLYYSQWVDYAEPTNVICYDLNAGQKAIITSGTFINLTEDVLYVSTEANGTYGTFKINRHDWSDWTDTGYETGRMQSVGAWLFDCPQESSDMIRWGLDTNSVTERILVTDPPQINMNTLPNQVPLFGRTDIGQNLVAKHDTDHYYVLAQESRDWIELPEQRDLSELIYNWAVNNCVKYDYLGSDETIPMRQIDVNMGRIYYVNDDAVYLEYPYTDVKFNTETNENGYFNWLIVKFAPGEEPVPVGGVFMQ